MRPESIFANIRREDDKTYTTAYGPFVLQSAFQPIFGQDADGMLELAAFEGLVRAARNGAPVSPGEFFPLVRDQDMPAIDSLCRTLHLMNMGQMQRSKAKLFVNFHPGMFTTIHDIRQEVDRIAVATHEAGLTPDRVVCEISYSDEEREETVLRLTAQLRNMGFKIAVDEYGAHDSDAQRLEMLKPDYVKFEASWVLDFLENPTGHALLKVMVKQFLDRGIMPIFEGLEEISQVDLCQELGVPYVQGYIFARPEIAPTTFEQRFPERQEFVRPAHRSNTTSAQRKTASFGRRGS